MVEINKYNASRKSRRAVPAHSWKVVSRKTAGVVSLEEGASPRILGEGDVIHSVFGVDDISGLTMGAIDVIESRSGGNVDPHKYILPGLQTPGSATLSGIYLYDMLDLSKMVKWHEDCIGGVNLTDRYRDFDLIPQITGSESQEVQVDDVVPGTITLHSCLCTNLSFSDLTQASSDPHRWQLEIRYTKLSTQGGNV